MLEAGAEDEDSRRIIELEFRGQLPQLLVTDDQAALFSSQLPLHHTSQHTMVMPLKALILLLVALFCVGTTTAHNNERSLLSARALFDVSCARENLITSLPAPPPLPPFYHDASLPGGCTSHDVSGVVQTTPCAPACSGAAALRRASALCLTLCGTQL